jgi:hypothetical protein
MSRTLQLEEARRVDRAGLFGRLDRTMIIQALLKILRGADVNCMGAKSEKVDNARALRRGPLALAQGHSPRVDD